MLIYTCIDRYVYNIDRYVYADCWAQASEIADTALNSITDIHEYLAHVYEFTTDVHVYIYI